MSENIKKELLKQYRKKRAQVSDILEICTPSMKCSVLASLIIEEIISEYASSSDLGKSVLMERMSDGFDQISHEITNNEEKIVE